MHGLPYKALLIFIGIGLNSFNLFSQCCAGGSGSPIAGGASQGVLQLNQVDFNTNYQHIATRKFLKGDAPTKGFLENYKSNYIYNRIGYGVSKDFTMYIETGYFVNKTQVTLNKAQTLDAKGFGDLILFPRMTLINKSKKNKKTELTLGIGYKIPLGKYNDSFKQVEPFSGEIFYITKPLLVQPTSGAHDLIFYSFFLKDFTNIRYFANATYIKKGWNPLGEKMGNYLSIGVFASKTLFQSVGISVQIRAEWIDQMKLNKNILLYAYPNYDYLATGSKKIFFTPQISYTYQRKLTGFVLTEIPLYQKVNRTQIASQTQITAGVSYRFMLK